MASTYTNGTSITLDGPMPDGTYVVTWVIEGTPYERVVGGFPAAIAAYQRVVTQAERGDYAALTASRYAA